MAGVQGFKTFAVLALLLVFLAVPMLAKQRVALVIGNASYAHASRLANPLNAAADMSAALARLGFAVPKLGSAKKWGHSRPHGSVSDALSQTPSVLGVAARISLAHTDLQSCPHFLVLPSTTNFQQHRRVPVQLITQAGSKRLALKGIPFLEPAKTRVWHDGFTSEALNWVDWGDCGK